MPELYDKRSQNCATQSFESLKSSKLLGTCSCCVPTMHLGALETNPFFPHIGSASNTGTLVKILLQIFRIKKPGRSLRQEKQKIHIFKGLVLILIKIDTILHSRTLHMRMNKK